MKELKSKLKKVRIFKYKPFFDHRGKYLEFYNKDFFNRKKIKLNFIQDDISISKKGVMRGIHGDNKTWKLVTCLYGEFKLIVVNNDKKSKDFKKHLFITLSDKNRLQVLIPPKFGNGHYVLKENSIFHYKQTTNYERKSQFTIKWNSKEHNFNWNLKKKPILSKRDDI